MFQTRESTNPITQFFRVFTVYIASFSKFCLNFLCSLLINIAVFSLVFTPTFSYALPTQNGLNDGHISNLIPSIETTNAGLIQIDGSTNTGLDNSINNVPIVNIATPSAGGVSQNNFHDFNVGNEGIIMNNSNQIAESQLGGAIYANPNLAPNQNATIILNEVTSTNPSKLLGYTEIHGYGAEYILANPNGITCKGCGFINTPKVSLITGKSTINDGISGFNISQNGSVNIEMGSIFGLDAQTIDSFDIITRMAKINGTIYAKNLTIKTGNDHYNYKTKTITSKDSDTTLNASKPVVAIDSSALGGMYAGRIVMESTEKGVGINAGAHAFSYVDGITISANGDINYVNLTANKSVNLASTTEVISDDTDIIATNSDINIASKNGYEIKGQFVANNNLNINSDGNITNKTNLQVKNQTTISTQETFTNEANKEVSSNSNTNITAKNIVNNGYINSGNNVTLITIEDIINNGGILAINNANFAGNNITNTGVILAKKDINFYANNDIKNQSTANNSAIIDADSNINIQAKNFINEGFNFDNDDTGNFGYTTKKSVPVGGWGNGYYNLMYQDQTTDTLDTIASLLQASGNITFTNTNIINKSSSIISEGNIVINGGSLTNIHNSVSATLNEIYGKHWSVYKGWFKRGRFKGKRYHYYNQYTKTFNKTIYSKTAPTLYAKGNLIVDGTSSFANGVPQHLYDKKTEEEASLSSLNTNKTNVQTQYDSLVAEEKSLKEYTPEKALTNPTLTNLNEHKTELDSNISTFQTDISNINTQIANTTDSGEISALNEQKQEMEGLLSDSQSLLTNVNTNISDINTLNTEINTLQTNHNTLTNTVTADKTTLTNLQAIVSPTSQEQNQITTLQSDISSNEVKLSSLQTQINTKETQNTNLTKQTHTNYINGINSQQGSETLEVLAEITTQKAGLSRTITALESGITTKTQEITSIQNEIDNSQINLQTQAKPYNPINQNSLDLNQQNPEQTYSKPNFSTSDLRSSWYFLDRIGFDADEDFKIVQDPLFENKVDKRREANISAENVVINSNGSVQNLGEIFSEEMLAIHGDFISNTSKIRGNDIILSSNGNIINRGGAIVSSTNLEITTGNNFVNQNVKITNGDLQNNTQTQDEILSKGRISAQENINIASENSTYFVGSEAYAGIDFNINTGNKIDILTEFLNGNYNAVMELGETEETEKKQSTTNISSILTAENGNINFTSGIDINIKSAEITGNDINLTAIENVNLLSSKDTDSYHYKYDKQGTWSFTTKDKGHYNETLNLNKFSSPLNINSSNINIDRQENLNQNPYDILSNANMNFTNISLQNQEWNEEFSGLSSLAVGLIAVACVLAGGVAGAMIMGSVAAGASTMVVIGHFAAIGAIGAGIGTASTMATVTTANTLLNGDNALKAQEKLAKEEDTWKQIGTSVVIGAMLGAVKGWIQVHGHTPTLEKGGDAVWKPSKALSNTSEFKTIHPNYNGVIDPTANNIGLANLTDNAKFVGNIVQNPSFFHEGGKMSVFANKLGGMNSMSLMHDGWSQNAFIQKFPILQASIVPAIAVEYCLLSPELCTAVINNDTTKKDFYN